MTLENTAGCRILVVEDETLIAFEIEAVLEALECAIIGPVGTLDGALRLAHHAAPDAAILDVTVRGGKSYPVAEQLLARGVPFVLSSGLLKWCGRSLDALLAAGERPGREVAVIFDGVPAILDTAHLRLVFIDVMGSRHRGPPVRKT